MKTYIPLRFSLVATLAAFAFVSLHAAQLSAAPATDFKFQFGADTAAPGYTLVQPTLMWSKETGHGFEPGSTVTTVTQDTGEALHQGAVTDSQPFYFSVAVPEGNYRVTVT